MSKKKPMMTRVGKKFGDRRDGKLIRDLDGMHFVTSIIYPNRCDNEAFISERIDLTAAEEYLAKKNAENPEYHYNLFQIIVAAMMKTLTLRPKMNRFIANGYMYQRDQITSSFVVKKQFRDDGAEGLAFLQAEAGDTIDTIHEKIWHEISDSRGGKSDGTEDGIDFFGSIPRIVSKTALHGIMWLERHDMVPAFLLESDPYYSSVVLSNLGSIGLHSGYHHLTNWGTNSVFVAIGEKKKRPFYDDEGNVTMRMSVDIGITIDERLADGYYYSKSIRLAKKLMEHPELLETRMDEPVDY